MQKKRVGTSPYKAINDLMIDVLRRQELADRCYAAKESHLIAKRDVGISK